MVSSHFLPRVVFRNVAGHVCSRSAQKYVNQRHEIDTLRRVDDHQPRGSCRAASRRTAKHQNKTFPTSPNVLFNNETQTCNQAVCVFITREGGGVGVRFVQRAWLKTSHHVSLVSRAKASLAD